MAARKLTPISVTEVDDEADENVELVADAELVAEGEADVPEPDPVPESLPVLLSKDYCWCGAEAVLTTDGKTANVVSFCRPHLPPNLRGRR